MAVAGLTGVVDGEHRAAILGFADAAGGVALLLAVRSVADTGHALGGSDHLALRRLAVLFAARRGLVLD
jgi:hypothetical protein